VNELVGEELNDCELGYVTAIMLFEAVLEIDDEPLIRRPSSKKDKPGDELINGLETADRQHVIKRKCLSIDGTVRNTDRMLIVIDGTRLRLRNLRNTIQARQEASKRGSQTGSGNATPRPGSNISPAVTPAVGSTPPK
jgi:serine/threonine-protein kinase ULK2